MLSRHYATRHRLVHGNVEEELKKTDPNRVGIISFSTRYENIPVQQQFILSPAGRLDEAAQQLFAAMRRIDRLDIDVILAEVFPEEGLGRAINDRLKRAGVPA
jgi:L-threonylcarbamoyladenylate synthase